MKRPSKVREKRAFRVVMKTGALVVVCAAMFGGGWFADSRLSQPAPEFSLPNNSFTSIITRLGLEARLRTVKVDVFGGSMAHGWVDPNNDSYLRRAFALRTETTNTTYDYLDHTIVGETPLSLQQSGQYLEALKNDHPSVVVLSWGLLNSMDSQHKITVTEFGNVVQSEISEALAEHAEVLIVTPPVVKASATTLHAMQEVYIKKLFSVATSFHSKNVVVFDVYHQMEAYLAAHGQTYENYYNGNSWHPDEAGHELAGMLLFNDMVQTFGVAPIEPHSTLRL